MWTRFDYVGQQVRDFVFKILSPPFCEYCRCFVTKRSLLCADCLQKITPLVAHELLISATHKVPVYAVGAYQEPLKSLVLAKNRAYRLASVYLAEQIYTQTAFSTLPCDYLIPIPLHWSRALRRGYNQSAVMAERLQQLQSTTTVANILKRVRATKYQSGLTKLERATNLTKAFVLKEIEPELYRDKNLILVDDVFTSGATLAAAARELYKLQPKSLAIVVACRAI